MTWSLKKDLIITPFKGTEGQPFKIGNGVIKKDLIIHPFKGTEGQPFKIGNGPGHLKGPNYRPF